MPTLNGLSLQTVNGVDREVRKVTSRVATPGLGRVTQNLVSEDDAFTIRGVLSSGAEAARLGLENIRYMSQPVLLDLTDLYAGLLAWVRVTESKVTPRGPVNYYEVRCEATQGIGVWFVQTDDAYLHDYPEYRGRLRVLDPYAARSGAAYAYASSRDQYTTVGYLDNDKNDIQAPILEMTAGDDLATLELFGWKAGAWSRIDEWGVGATAWGTAANWDDGDGVTHAFKPNTGLRGATVAGVGTASNRLGCNGRVLMSVSALQADSGASPDLSTDYGSDQLLLKSVLKHTRRESARPYSVITYVDGSLDEGPA